MPDRPPPRLLDRVRAAARLRHLSRRTEKTYVHWIRRFVVFHGKRHPDEMGEPEVTRFLSALATEGRVSASTQNQALAALLFLYRVVLGRELAWLDEVVRAKRPARLPVVLLLPEGQRPAPAPPRRSRGRRGGVEHPAAQEPRLAHTRRGPGRAPSIHSTWRCCDDRLNPSYTGLSNWS
jgi:hypothetical protein